MAFAERWYLFGGGDPADIWVEFGVTEAVFFARLRQVIEQSQELSRSSLGQAIGDVAARRLAALDDGHRQNSKRSDERRHHPSNSRLAPSLQRR